MKLLLEVKGETWFVSQTGEFYSSVFLLGRLGGTFCFGMGLCFVGYVCGSGVP